MFAPVHILITDKLSVWGRDHRFLIRAVIFFQQR